MYLTIKMDNKDGSLGSGNVTSWGATHSFIFLLYL